MIRFLVAALLCALFTMPAAARQGRHGALACVETGDIMRPFCGSHTDATPRGFLDGVRSIRVTMKRERVSSRQVPPTGLLAVMQTGADRIARPGRYIAGRLICAVNVGAALAERGIKGTGSALALSYLQWGRASGPVPGAVAVSSRRGGGHVAIVSRVEGNQVYVWNPSPRGRGWQEVAYRHRALSYRVPG
ncbi:hypothetical protein [Tardiphaga sp.]|uniref:hypothetical protein n=1 Tax=Tardiphaga sp. TaxID=1926292 RepID=UPI00262B574B|nr:hypothetical protein [Tardiphaga sp.]MDB5620667.1 hypothetical protein [Tardiphaga sp.]